MEHLVIPLPQPRSRYAYSPLTHITLPDLLMTPRPDLGKVLAGIQVPPEDTEEFECFLKKLRYPYVEETNNPVVRKYLRT